MVGADLSRGEEDHVLYRLRILLYTGLYCIYIVLLYTNITSISGFTADFNGSTKSNRSILTKGEPGLEFG